MSVREFTHRACTMRAPCQVFERLLQEMVGRSSPCIYCPWVEVAGGRVWQGVRAPLGVLTCNQCSNRLNDKLMHTNPYF